MGTAKMSDLKNIMLYNYRKEDASLVTKTVDLRDKLVEKIKKLETTLGEIGINHHKAYLAA
jgi:hypothetical protein